MRPIGIPDATEYAAMHLPIGIAFAALDFPVIYEKWTTPQSRSFFL
jgi:hypothetical protein